LSLRNHRIKVSSFVSEPFGILELRLREKMDDRQLSVGCTAMVVDFESILKRDSGREIISGRPDWTKAESRGEEWPDENMSADEAVELRPPKSDNRFLDDEELRSEEELIKFHGLESVPNVADRREAFLGVGSCVLKAMVSECWFVLSSLCENHFGAI
jgi:hypothetical protein